jgi:hypothetical protein
MESIFNLSLINFKAEWEWLFGSPDRCSKGDRVRGRTKSSLSEKLFSRGFSMERRDYRKKEKTERQGGGVY